MWKTLFVGTLLLALTLAYQALNTTNGLHVYDMIEWNGVINAQRRPATLFILSPYSMTDNYSVMKMEIQGSRYRLAFSSGITGRETLTKPKAHCELGQVRVGPGMRFRAIIRVMPRDILVYWNGELVFTMSLTSVFQNLYLVRRISVQGLDHTESFKFLSDEDLVSELNDPECGTVTSGTPVPSFCQTDEDCPALNAGTSRPGLNPWQAAIRLRHSDNQDETHICGAVLIGRCWALSAAHCFNTLSSNWRLDELVVRVGDYYNRDNETHSRDQTVENSQDLEIDSLITHRDYQTFPSPQNDITIIKLRQCVTYNKFVKPACLPNPVDQFSNSQYVCGVSGWGASNPPESPNQYPSCLQSSLVQMRSNSVCNRKYEDYFDPRIMVCASADSCADTCYGDSGGPLMCLATGQSKYTLWGITSWGVRCGTWSYPGIYVKVSFYLRWLYTTMRLSPSQEALIEILSPINLHDTYNCVDQN